MTKKLKLVLKLLNRPKNIRFSEAQTAIEAFGYKLARIRGSHHLFIHPEIPEPINIQNVRLCQAVPDKTVPRDCRTVQPGNRGSRMKDCHINAF